MSEKYQQHIFVLSGAYDDHYRLTRKDNPITCTSAGKRIILYQAVEHAVGIPVVLLSPHPRGRSVAKSLPDFGIRFGKQIQLFSKASGIRKVRFLLDIFYYARHVAKHIKTGDIVVIDNFELIYVLAIQYCRLLGRKNHIIIEYEDGKHLIDKGIWRWMSGFAEWLARPWLAGAILAAPKLAERLPINIPKILVPGILRDGIRLNPPPSANNSVVFLYSGSLDVERGGPLLLSFLEAGNFPPRVEFHITGQGHYTDRLLAVQNRFPQTIYFHGTVSQEELDGIRRLSHFGLNLQSSTNPISQVTYPSKTFDYVNSGIRVISTRAADVERVLGESAIYLEEETSTALFVAIEKAAAVITASNSENCCQISMEFTYSETIQRLSTFFQLQNSRGK